MAMKDRDDAESQGTKSPGVGEEQRLSLSAGKATPSSTPGDTPPAPSLPGPSEHAPAPWRIEGEFDVEVSITILDAEDNVVFELESRSPDGWDEPTIASAQLMTAAPELLAALRLVEKWGFLGKFPGDEETWKSVVYAIAKAEGRS